MGPNNLDYGEIPSFISQDGSAAPLSDYLDFRPVRLDATNTVTANNYVFDVDSYTRLGPGNLDYAEIPNFISQDGSASPLSDYLDFRPVRLDATSTFTANNYVFDVEERGAGPKIIETGTDAILDYSY